MSDDAIPGADADRDADAYRSGEAGIRLDVEIGAEAGMRSEAEPRSEVEPEPESEVEPEPGAETDLRSETDPAAATDPATAPAIDPALATDPVRADAESAPLQDSAAPRPAPATPSSASGASPRPAEEVADLNEVSRAAEGGASLRMLLETAVTRRSVEEVADLVTLLRRSGQVPDAADQALRAAAVSRPIEDVISLAVLLAQEDEAQDRPQVDPEPEPVPRRGHRPEPERRAARPRPARKRAPRAPRADRPTRKAAKAAKAAQASEPDASRGAAGRVLRWPVAAVLAVSGLLYLPRHPARLLDDGGLSAWVLLGLAGVCLTLAALVLGRERAWVWTAATVTGIGLVLVHALATVLEADLAGGAGGALVPWAGGAAMLAAGLVAALSVLALLYRSDQPDPEPELPVLVLPDTVPSPLDTPSDPAPGLAPVPPHEAEAAAP
ncbi:hypothetical protein ACFWUQ_23610 [Streptomyces sp. NPDC058662]|uniref:hypothetical protein n=1 Tax=Streptomyces sp. NPDC058662 TaxID=3346583 RepID=UPI0036470E1C